MLQLAILDQLRSPSPAFASLIRDHFALKKAEVLQQMDEWCTRMAHHHTLSKEVWVPATLKADIKSELDKLPLY